MEKRRREYNDRIEAIRSHEYPMLHESTYLDHAGTTLYSRSLIESFSKEMMLSLMGNPHSASTSANSTGHRVETVRARVLQFFNADPQHFDVVFVANATAAIKLVADTFRDQTGGFRYLYHRDCHTSLVGVRELATRGSRCLRSDNETIAWLDSMPAEENEASEPLLFAYPAQSNMNGRRLPLSWPGRLRQSGKSNVYSLLDVAAFVSTAPLDLSNIHTAPDFVSLSFYKIFGFPDLGALIVRKDAAPLFDRRRFFGGGTVEMVASLDGQWHKKKESSLHARLEDGSLPIRNILALGCALDAHPKLFGPMINVSQHTSWLAATLYSRMTNLKHYNGRPVCELYKDVGSNYGDSTKQGAVVTFNLLDSQGNWISNYELNRLTSAAQIHIRTGTLCNPGGMASALKISSAELERYYKLGFRCGGKEDVREGKVVGMARISFGAPSTMNDVDQWIRFLQHTFLEQREADDLKAFETPAAQPNSTKTHRTTHRYITALLSLARLRSSSKAPMKQASCVSRISSE